jgi:hypothetical protein
MHSAGARALREDDNEMSREAVLLQWERKIEVAERLEEDGTSGSSADGAEATEVAEPVVLHPDPATRRGRFERSAPAPSAPEPSPLAPEPVAERRTITITGRPDPGAAPARRRRAVVDAHIAQPDRIALWAFLLGLLLVAVAAGTAHA